MERPRYRELAGVMCFIDDHGPIVRQENFLADPDDMVMLNPGDETSWLDRALLAFLVRADCCFVRVSVHIHVYIP